MKFQYIEMKYEVNERDVIPRQNLDVQEITLEDLEELLELYLYAFEETNATFFLNQDERKKIDYFLNDLGLPYCLDSSSTIKLVEDNEIVGFALCLPYGIDNTHVTCMVVHPKKQSKGYGTYMLDLINKSAYESGLKTITLGTEPSMNSYRLYKKYGFEDMEQVEIETSEM